MSTSSESIVIVGLGNPGREHAGDRHNVGFWLVDQLATHAGAHFSPARKLLAETAQCTLAGQPVRLVKPQTYMNRSGQCVRHVLDYYKVSLARVLVVHDDLDLPPGVARLKRGGGHGGHNGLRDITAHCGAEFLRLRIGIGHPGHKDAVVAYVLHAPGKVEHARLLDALEASVAAVETLLASGLERATRELHTATRPEREADLGPAG